MQIRTKRGWQRYSKNTKVLVRAKNTYMTAREVHREARIINNTEFGQIVVPGGAN
ncbi:MAG: hypothetical protein N4A63_13755 [Vallitalea sp.]|nr:hypothetical protein [Vallitalea sp.]